MDVLIYLHRHLQGVVDLFGVRRLARKVFRPLYYFFYSNDRLARAKQNGRTWLLHPDVALAAEYYELSTVQWFRTQIKPGNTVFDVGANVGQLTLELAELVGPAGQVIAIEPALGNLKLLRRHLDANRMSGRVRVVEAACTDQHKGSISFRVFGGVNEVGSGHTINLDCKPTSSGEAESVISTVPTVSIDGLCDEMQLVPNVIKIDTEGAEIVVLKGALKTLKLHRPKLIIGFHPFAFADAHVASQEFLGLLADCGYSVSHLTAPLELKEYPFC